MENLETCLINDFEQQMSRIRLTADDLPAALIIHRCSDMQVIYMNKAGLDGLGISMAELSELNNEAYHSKYFNKEDSNDYVPKILNLINGKGVDVVNYFQQVRNQQNKGWMLFASNTKVFHRNDLGEATHMITMATKIDPVHHITKKVDRMMEELDFFRNNNPLYLKLTRREREILRCIALGMNTAKISSSLFISPATVDTHRKNLRQKLGLKNFHDTLRFAQAYNLI